MFLVAILNLIKSWNPQIYFCILLKLAIFCFFSRIIWNFGSQDIPEYFLKYRKGKMNLKLKNDLELQTFEIAVNPGLEPAFWDSHFWFTFHVTNRLSRRSIFSPFLTCPTYRSRKYIIFIQKYVWPKYIFILEYVQTSLELF